MKRCPTGVPYGTGKKRKGRLPTPGDRLVRGENGGPPKATSEQHEDESRHKKRNKRSQERGLDNTYPKNSKRNKLRRGPETFLSGNDKVLRNPHGASNY